MENKVAGPGGVTAIVVRHLHPSMMTQVVTRCRGGDGRIPRAHWTTSPVS